MNTSKTIAGLTLTDSELESLVELALVFYKSEELLRDALAWHRLDKINESAFPDLHKAKATYETY